MRKQKRLNYILNDIQHASRIYEEMYQKTLNHERIVTGIINDTSKKEVDNEEGTEAIVDIRKMIVENPIYRARQEIMEDAKASDYSRKHINKIIDNPIYDLDVDVGKQATVLCSCNFTVAYTFLTLYPHNLVWG